MKRRSPRLRIPFDAAWHSARRRQPDLPRPVVLVLDDDPTHRRMVKVLLEVAVGVRILEAKTSEQALKLAEMFRPDLLISNLAGPCARDSLRFVQAFRAGHPGVPVVVVAGSLDPLNRGCALGFGTAGCASKMMVWSDLLETVRKALSRRQAPGVSPRLVRREGAWLQTVERCLRGRWGDRPK